MEVRFIRLSHFKFDFEMMLDDVNHLISIKIQFIIKCATQIHVFILSCYEVGEFLIIQKFYT